MEKPIQMQTELEMQEKVNAKYLEVLEFPEVKEALDTLDGLPENLKYHNKSHTLDVIKETILFALSDGVTDEVLHEQVTAAAWHDVGYVKQYENNESIAVEMFKKSESYKTLSPEISDMVIADILDTQMKMRDGEPHLEKEVSTYGYILDADVSNFGRDDYFQKRALVAMELGLNINDLEVKKKFFEFAINLLKNHEWQTPSARDMRQAKKEENLRRMEEEFAKL